MCQPRRWAWGLLPLALLWIASLLFITPSLEADLELRAKAAVSPNAPWASIKVDGRDAIIDGKAPAENAGRQAAKAVLQVDGIRLAVDGSQPIPEAKPFTWTAVRAGNQLTLGGHVAPDGARGKITNDAKLAFPNLPIIDEMQDARGAPSGSLAMVAVALGQLAKLRNGSASLSDSEFSIKGTATDAAAASAAIASASRLPQPMTLRTIEVVPLMPVPQAVAAPVPKAPVIPVERPYKWQAVKSADTVVLSGAVPSEAARNAVAAAARLAAKGAKFVDEMKIASGLPGGVDFAAATTFAAAQLGQLRSGTVKIIDAQLTIDGEALDAASYKAVSNSTAGALPGGLKLDQATILPPRVVDYVWSAKREGQTLVLTGYFPDEPTRQTLASALEQRFANFKITNRTSIASGAPQGFAPAMAMGLDQLARLDQGSATVAGSRLTVTGTAPSATIAGEVTDALRKLAGGVTTEANVSFRPAPVAASPVAPAPVIPQPPPAAPTVAAPPSAITAPLVPATVAPPIVKVPAEIAAPAASTPPGPSSTCFVDLTAMLKQRRINFQSSRADMITSSAKAVSDIAGVLKRCPELKIEVAGHTDGTGSEAVNQSLSLQRAEAVAKVLIQAGVDAARVTTAGYGATRPIDSNATVAGKAMNRRIEFTPVQK